MMPDPYATDDAHVIKERRKARALRQSQWWQRRLAKGICHYCRKPTAPRDLTMDHIVPLVRGGRSTKGNIVPCCKACNTAKHNRLLMEWDQYLEYLKKT
jgi:5-methylcytosine-specific restriction endonuclease McrA